MPMMAQRCCALLHLWRHDFSRNVSHHPGWMTAFAVGVVAVVALLRLW